MSGVKNIYIAQLKELYNQEVEAGQLVSPELLEAMALLTSGLNREVAVYLNRKGQITAVALGEHNNVSLIEQNLRRGTGRLSKLRCIHTHPNGSGMLSSVDIAALYSLRFDSMVAVGVSSGEIKDIWAGFIKPGGQQDDCCLLGPMNLQAAAACNFLGMVKTIEQELVKEYPVEADKAERALLVGVDFKGVKTSELPVRESLKEMTLLVETAGAKVVKEIIQSRAKLDSAFYIGRGLAEELRLLCQALRVNLTVFDAELSGTQLKNLEQNLGVKIVDRTGLILDIFAQRARSKEGKLQVELAQLEYLLPRLTGSGREMSRLAGGIGTRGPGETKLEKDKRQIRRRIFELKRELEQVTKQRAVIKAKRNCEFTLIALVGYTNAGKSTLRYKILAEAAQVPVDWGKEDPGTNQLFATLDPTVRGILLPDGQPALLADTVGFIQKLPHQLISAFKATLEEVVQADLLVHVADATSPYCQEQIQAVENVLQELNVMNKKMIIVYNKMDLLTEEHNLCLVQNYPTIEVSALTGRGIKELLKMIAGSLGIGRQEVRLAIPHGEAKMLATIYKEGKVQEVEYGPLYIYLRAMVDDALYSRLKEYLL